MRKALIAAAALVAAAATIGAVAAAAPASSKQPVIIEQKGDSFVLTPTSAGSIQPDRGSLSACCWTTRQVVVAGQRLDLNNPRLTLTGRNGTLKLRNRIVWVDLPGRWAIFTGTWKVVGGTGAYAGLSGHGRVVAAQTPGGYDRVRFFGFLSK